MHSRLQAGMFQVRLRAAGSPGALQAQRAADAAIHRAASAEGRGRALPAGWRPLVAWLRYFCPNNIVLNFLS